MSKNEPRRPVATGPRSSEPPARAAYQLAHRPAAQVIKDYVAHTNESLRAAVKEYFEDKAAAEYRHGKIGTWDVSRVTDMSRLFWNRATFDEDISAWDTSVATMKQMFDNYWTRVPLAGVFNQNIGRWDTL